MSDYFKKFDVYIYALNNIKSLIVDIPNGIPNNVKYDRILSKATKAAGYEYYQNCGSDSIEFKMLMRRHNILPSIKSLILHKLCIVLFAFLIFLCCLFLYEKYILGSVISIILSIFPGYYLIGYRTK